MNRQITLFLFLAFSISWGFDAIIVSSKNAPVALILPMMWGPGLAAMITNFVFNKSAKPPGLNFKNKQYLLAGYLLPFIYAIPVYAATWLMGFEPFNTAFHGNYFLLFIPGQLLQIFAASGEEIGWRGFLYPQLQKQFNSFMAALITGIIWAVWNFPWMVHNYQGGPPLWFFMSCYSLMIISISFIAAWLRDRSQNIWPAVLLLSSHNFYIQLILNNRNSNPDNHNYLYGEGGLGLAISTFVVACMLWIKHHKMLQTTTKQVTA